MTDKEMWEDDLKFIEMLRTENDILKRVRKRHQKTETKPNGTGWRTASNIKKNL